MAATLIATRQTYLTPAYNYSYTPLLLLLSSLSSRIWICDRSRPSMNLGIRRLARVFVTGETAPPPFLGGPNSLLDGVARDLAMTLLLFLLCLCSYSSGISPVPAWSPSNPPEISAMARFVPAPAPMPSPKYHGSFASPPVSKHHRRTHHAAAPTTFSPSEGKDCNGISCSDPLTLTPIDSPCGCILPIKIVVDLGVAPILLFPRIPELAVEVAAGTFLKQCQVKIMGADANDHDQQKTTVTIYLVPLGEKFDNMTALLIFERFWQRKVPIDMTVFGDYNVIYVHYPGLPSSPPSQAGESVGLGPTGTGIQQIPFTADVPTSISPKTNSIIITVIVLSSVILILVCLGVIFIVLKMKRQRRSPTAVGPAIIPSVTKRSGIKSMISTSMASSLSSSSVSNMPTCAPSVKTFSLAEIEKATERFSSRKVLGEGGFGRVYHGVMEDASEVAVKLLTREDHNKDREFIAEVEMLSRLHHRNLVKLIGICKEGQTRCLVYELIRNGNLESHLHGTHKKIRPLDWDARMKIALGSARGLAYLHEDSNPRVIHRDFKASNVLLEEDFTPKITDFGLAREASEGSHHISTRVMGTFGYVAPEYAMTGHLLVKSDVYSYGVVLLELLTGRKPVCMSQPEGSENLVTWARPLLTSREGLEQLIDPVLGRDYGFDNVARVAAIASMCVHVDQSQRPFMGEVVQALKLVYNDMDETCEDSYSQRESSIPYSDCKGDLGPESNWWSKSTPHFPYGYASSFMTMEYSGPMEDIQRAHSASSLVGRVDSMPALNRSGPLRTKRHKSAFYRLRGSMSEHGHLSRHLSVNGALGLGL